jgi:hypothetical protein
MKFKIFINAFLSILLLFVNISFSQYENSISGFNPNAPQSNALPFKSPVQGQYLRALILYVTFSDDAEQGPDWNIWNLHEQPYNPYLEEYKLIDNVEKSNEIPFMNRYSPYTYSDWFCQMSMGEFDFIGDEYHIELPLPSTEYYNGTNLWGSMNTIVLNYANTIIPGLDFTRYDKWARNGENWEWAENGDGTAEMIIIHYRVIPNNYPAIPPNPHEGWFWPPSVGGYSSLGFSTPITLDGITIKNETGVTALGLLNRLTRTQLIVEHEVCHYGIPPHYNIGLMTPGHSESSYIFNSFEKEMMTYQPATLVEFSPTLRYQEFTLGDFVESGDAYKFGIPGTINETFYLENHQKKSLYDGLSRGSKTCWETNRSEQDPFCPVGKGLYIYRQRYNGNTTIIDLKSSDGNWDWETERYANVPELGSTPTPLMKKSIWNPAYGKVKYHEVNLSPIPNTFSPHIIADNPCLEGANDVFITQDYHGSGVDAFNKDYDEIFSPYSNPNSSSFQAPSTNSGITIWIMNQNQTTGAITIRIYNNDTYALEDCPPSKPKGIKHEYYYPENGWCVPKITWHHNMEPDMLREDNTKRYEIWRATEPNMSNCDNFSGSYSLIYTKDVPANETPEYIDYSVLEYDCADLDQVPPFGTKYPVRYKVRAIDASSSNKLSVFSDFAATTGIIPNGGKQDGEGDNFRLNSNVPKEFNLSQNYPNPFNPVTKINFALPKQGFVSLKIYDITGREIQTLVNEVKQAGYYTVDFNGSSLASGVYFYRIQSGDFISVKRMVLVK